MVKDKTEILFCFDTEDFTSDYACDSIRDIALLLESEGIKGNFMMVGLVAKQLIKWKRYDVLEALSKHEIQFHTLSHSMHPTICEYTDIEDYKTAYDMLVKQEAEGIGMVKAAAGVDKIYAAVPPGPSFCYVAMYAYSDMGIPVYCDSPIGAADGSDIYYCNALHIEYNKCLESIFFEKKDFDVNSITEELSKRKRVILYNHPNMVLYKNFWDEVNYKKENKYEFGHWQEAVRRDKAESESFYYSLRLLIKKLKGDNRFCFKTVGDIVKEIKARSNLTIYMLPQIKKALEKDFSPVKEPSFSISEIFCAVVEFLKGKEIYIPSKTYGFLDTPKGIEKTCTITGAGLKKAAIGINTDYFLPCSIEVDGKNIGPADFLFAALEFLCEKKEELTLYPRPQLNSLKEFRNLENLSLKNSWIHSDAFEDKYQSDRLRLQAWTLRK